MWGVRLLSCDCPFSPGVYREPSLSAQPGSLVFSGDNLTLQCRSGAGFDRFALTKDEGLTSPQHLHGQHSPYFPLGHVSHTHGGQYRCYTGHNLSHAWSAPSDPLDILIVGEEPHVLIVSPGPWAQCHSCVVMGSRERVLEQRLGWGHGLGKGSEKGGVRDKEIKDIHPEGLRGAERWLTESLERSQWSKACEEESAVYTS